MVDIRAFLAEDVGDGDVTTEAVVPADARLEASLLLKEQGVVCGLAVVMRLESETGQRRLAVGGLCAAMAVLFLLSLFVPFLRDFYELLTLTVEAILTWAVGALLGVGGMLGGLHLLRV